MGNCPLSSQVVFPTNGDQTLQPPSSTKMITGNKTPASYVASQLPLTERDVFSITKSWKTISKTMTNIGVAIFIKLVLKKLLN